MATEESRQAGVLGGKARRRDVAGARHPQNGSMETGTLRAKGGRAWGLGVEYQGGGRSRGGQMGENAKGRHQIHPDVQVSLRMK